MYFPKGFNTDLSIELAELVSQAYAQFDAFEKDRIWKLPGKYLLKGEFYHVWSAGETIEQGVRRFDLPRRRLSRSKGKKIIKIPIGFVAQRKEGVFLIFRGTQTVKEWMRNISIRLSPYQLPNFGKVHGGFLQAYNSVRRDVLQTLSEKDQKKKVYVAGHSLGAALATLALPDIEANLDCRISALYTYGSPRVGDDMFVKAFNSVFGQRSFRIANTSDIVTSIPLPAPIAGIVGGYFSHVETPVDLTIQTNDLEENHKMKTYLFALKETKRQKGFFEKLIGRGV